MMKSKKTIVICTSSSFYKQAVEAGDLLEGMGFKVLLPHVASIMRKQNDFDRYHFQAWHKDPSAYKRKKTLILQHFKKIKKGDIILVLNYKKKNRPGYIGGNVLLEMGAALEYRKKIFILNPIDETSSFKEEILGMLPKILNGDLSKIT